MEHLLDPMVVENTINAWGKIANRGARTVMKRWRAPARREDWEGEGSRLVKLSLDAAPLLTEEKASNNDAGDHLRNPRRRSAGR